jgi:hypothetical protein
MVKKRYLSLLLGGVGLVTALLCGSVRPAIPPTQIPAIRPSQTWSPHILNQAPVYFAPSPDFPLDSELAQQERNFNQPSDTAHAETSPAPIAP